MEQADELVRLGVLLVPSAIPCSLSPLIFRIHSCLFSDCRRTVSLKFFDTQVLSISTEKLVLSCVCYNGHSLLLSSYLSRIGRIERALPATPTDTCPRTPFISLCTVQLRTLCITHSLVTLCLFTTSGPGPGELPGLWGSLVFCHAPIPQKGSGN